MQPPSPPQGPPKGQNNPYMQGQPDPYGQSPQGHQHQGQQHQGQPHQGHPHQRHPQQGYAHPGQAPYGHPQHGAAQPPAKKSNRGCWIVVISGLSVMLLLVVVGSYALYRAAEDTPVGDILWAVGEGAEAINEGRSAPGTDALREAGCSEAIAIEFKRFMKIAERFDAGASEPPPEMPGTMVTCTLGFMKDTSGAATCHHYAKVYIDGGGVPDGDFMLVVSKNGRNEGTCSEMYEADGTHVPTTTPSHPAYGP